MLLTLWNSANSWMIRVLLVGDGERHFAGEVWESA
jgi:hypothetical protein